MSADEYDIYSVDMLGNIINHHTDAVLTEWSDELNSFKGGFKFVKPDISPIPYEGALTEYQVWRKGKFFDWGISTKPKSTPNSGGKLEVQCNSLLWYFSRRVFGSANPTNLLINSDFEDDPLGITFPTGWYHQLCTSAVWDGNVLTGTKSVRLANDTEQADAYIGQDVGHFTGLIEGDSAVLTAWFFLEVFEAPALEQRGIYMDTTIDNVSQGPSWFPLTQSQPTGVWTRAQAAGFQPVNVPDGGYDCRLYVPKGIIVYDTCSLQIEESIHSSPAGTDQAQTFQDILFYAQDDTQGKSDLHIGNSVVISGVIRNLQYLFHENRQIFDALLDFTKYYDGLEFGMEFPEADTATPGNLRQRIVKTYPIIPGSSMGKGRIWTADELLLRVNIEVSTVEPAQDADQITTAMIVQSGQQGVGREQGGYVDASHYGGLILETVEQAPENTSLNALTGLAKKRVQQLNSGANIPVIKTRETLANPIIGRLKNGDIVPVLIDYGGWAHWQDSYRVVKMTLTPNTNELDLTLNIVSL